MLNVPFNDSVYLCEKYANPTMDLSWECTSKIFIYLFFKDYVHPRVNAVTVIYSHVTTNTWTTVTDSKKTSLSICWSHLKANWLIRSSAIESLFSQWRSVNVSRSYVNYSGSARWLLPTKTISTRGYWNVSGSIMSTFTAPSHYIGNKIQIVMYLIVISVNNLITFHVNSHSKTLTAIKTQTTTHLR